MKRSVGLLTFVLSAFISFAQTPEQIISRMDQALSGCQEAGLSMVVDMAIPILGNVTTTNYFLGDRLRTEGEIKGEKFISWSDGNTEWTYRVTDNIVEIRNAAAKSSAQEGDIGLFTNITDGYDVTLTSETDSQWDLLCKKNKSNKDKNSPKTMHLSVYKATCFPKSLSFKMSGITVTMRKLSFGVSEKQVLFDIGDYPDAKVVDRR